MGDLNVLAVPCPWCGARPGQYCVRKRLVPRFDGLEGGRVRRCHNERGQAARAALR